MRGVLFLNILLVFALVFLGSLAACEGGDGDDDDDDTGDDENAIKEVIQELIEGYLAGTEDSLNKKVFPHISEDYNYAGLDKKALQQSLLDEILDEERPEFGKPTIEQDVKVNGKKATDDAIAQTDVNLPWAEEEVGFSVSGSARLGMKFDLQKEGDGKWRVTAIKTAPSSMVLSGAKDGHEDSLPQLSDIELLPKDTVAPKGSVSISGQADLDVDNYVYWGSFSLDWYDFRPNLWDPSIEEDSSYAYDFTTTKGSFELDATLPDDGTPQGIEIPKTLNLGDDYISARLFIFAFDDFPWEGGSITSASLRIWFIPLSPFENEDLKSCENEPLDEKNHSGIWLVHIDEFTINQLLDLSIQDDIALAHVHFIDRSGQNPQNTVFPISGNLTSEHDATLSFTINENCPPDNPLVIEYQIHFSGTSGSGTVSRSGCEEEPFTLDLELEKLSNRCEYITAYEDILGENWTFVHPDYGNWTMKITDAGGGDCYFVLLNDASSFYMCRKLNIGWGYHAGGPNGTYDIGFAFNDLNSGIVILNNYVTGDYRLSTFYR